MSYSKIIPICFIMLFAFIQCKNKNTPISDPLIAADTWRKETIELPLSFAPSINYKGTQYVRFAPGWGKESSEEYFSYVFLWYLDEDPKLSSDGLELKLEAYFDGLMDITSKTKAFFEKINDNSYAGKVITSDNFISKKEVSLNIVTNYIYCENVDKHAVIFRISPQNIDLPIWKKLNDVRINIDCK